MTEQFKEGDKVILDPSTPYSKHMSNPSQDSEWACEGTVTRIQSDGWVSVLWDNGSSNSYCPIQGGLRSAVFDPSTIPM